MKKEKKERTYIGDYLQHGKEGTVRWLLIFKDRFGGPATKIKDEVLRKICDAGGAVRAELEDRALDIELSHLTTPRQVLGEYYDRVKADFSDATCCSVEDPDLQQIAQRWNFSVEQYWEIRAMSPHALRRLEQLEKEESRRAAKRLQRMIRSEAARTDDGPRF